MLHIETFFDEDTATFSHVLIDKTSSECAIIDSVLDYDPASGTTKTISADDIVRFVDEHQYKVAWILETHVHADHLSAANYLQKKLGGKVGIGEKITLVQEHFGDFFNVGNDFTRDGSQFDHLFSDGDHLQVGQLDIEVMHTPGHTPACMTYVCKPVGQAPIAFVGDTIFMPDYGTARCDFPHGSASDLYHSIQKLFALPDETQLYMCHDYKPDAPGPRYLTTVAAERQHNIQIHEGISCEDFVSMRRAKDATLGAPRLLLPSIQVNMRAGCLPPAEANGIAYMKIPLNQL